MKGDKSLGGRHGNGGRKNNNRHGNKHGGGKGLGGGKSKGSFSGDFLKKPGRFVKPVSGKEFKRETRANTKLEYGAASRELAAEKAASAQQQQNITGYFADYQKSLNRSKFATAAAYKTARDYIAKQSATAAKQSGNTNKLLNAQEAKDAKLRGGTQPKAAQTKATKATGARYSSGNNFGGMVATQGASQQAYLADKSTIGKGEEANQHILEAGNSRAIDQRIRDLADQKRASIRDFINTLRPQERDFYLALKQARNSKQASKLSAKTSRQNAKLSAKISRQNAKLSSNTSLRNNRADNRQSNINSQRTSATSRANSRRSARNSAASRRQSRREFNRTHTKSGKSKGTAGSSSSGSGGRGKAVADLRYYLGVHGNNSIKSKQQAVAILIHEGYSHKTASSAVHHMLHGGKKKHKPHYKIQPNR